MSVRPVALILFGLSLLAAIPNGFAGEPFSGVDKQAPPTVQPPTILIALLMPAVQKPRLGGVHVATGDVNGDGVPDLVGSPGVVTLDPCKAFYQCLVAVDLVIRNNTGRIVASTKTDFTGAATIQIPESHLAEAPFTLDVEGNSLATEMDKLFPQPATPEAPAKKKSGHSFSIGLGIGGGSSHTSTTPAAAPKVGASPKGEGGGSQTTSSGGGMGLGLSIPIGGGRSKKQENSQNPTTVQPQAINGGLIGLLIPAKPTIMLGGSTTSVPSPAEEQTQRFANSLQDGKGNVAFTVTPVIRDADGTTLHIPFPANIGTSPIVVRMAAVRPTELEPVNSTVAGSITKDSWTTKGTPAALATTTTPGKDGSTAATRTNTGVVGYIDGHAAPVSPNAAAVPGQNPTVVTAPTTRKDNVTVNWGDGSPTAGLSNVRLIVKNGEGQVILNSLTDAKGALPLKGLKPGTYTVEVDGPSYAASFEKTFFDHNLKRSSSAAPGTPYSGISVLYGAGIANPADTYGAKSPESPARKLFSVEAPYCPDSASKGTRFTFTVSPTTGTESAGPQGYEAKYDFFTAALFVIFL